MLYKLILLLTGFYFLSSAFANSWSCSVASNTTFVPNIALAEAQYGSASYLHGDLAEPWPLYTTRDDRKFRGVRYCFENKEAKAALSCKWWAALGLWIRLLGRPGETSGHSLAWQEAGNGEMDPKLRETHYCYSGITGFWDKRVADDTLVIRVITDSSQSGATVGYKGVNGGEHPHSLTLGAKASVPVIAHELGHVLGMVHEHTRNDRDQYVRFNCEALRGYHDALGRAMSLRISPAEAHRRLCEDPEFAKLYGFKSTQYLKNDRLSTTPDKWGALDEPGGYDIRSIMHYSSYAFGDIEDCIASKDYCPLVEIVKDAQGKEVDTRLIPQPVQPSTRDLDWVRRNYCWPADGNCHL